MEKTTIKFATDSIRRNIMIFMNVLGGSGLVI
jgi:hypothetical protein